MGTITTYTKTKIDQLLAGLFSQTIADAKGDLIVATAADTMTRLAVGSNGQVLTADSTQSTGVKWAAAGGGAAGPCPPAWVGSFLAMMPHRAAQRSVEPSKGGNRLGGLQVTLTKTYFVSSISLYVDTAVASGTARVGIYLTDTDGQPTTTLWDSGSIDCSTTGVKTISVAGGIPAGTYWVLATVNNTTIRLKGWALDQYAAGSSAFSTFYSAVFGSVGAYPPSSALPDLSSVAVGQDDTTQGGAPVLQLNVTGLS